MSNAVWITESARDYPLLIKNLLFVLRWLKKAVLRYAGPGSS